MSKIFWWFVASPLFEVVAVWTVSSLITVAFRPGSELEAWTKQKGPRYDAALQMLRAAATDLPVLADAVATFLWKRTPAEAQAQLTSAPSTHTTRVVMVSGPPLSSPAPLAADPLSPPPLPPPLPRIEP